VTTTINDIGKYLEKHAKIGEPVTYGQLLSQFPALPPLDGNWRSHPLCSMFGELDDDDHRHGRPFRTAMVFAKETGRPGQGFFDTVSSLRNKTILKGEQDLVWLAEVSALTAHYGQGIR
jgi:hypothetical protein